MIANVPLVLIVLMFLLTLLGGAIGYCVALLFVKKSVRKAIDAHLLELQEERLLLEAQRRWAVEDGISQLSDPVHPVIEDRQSIAEGHSDGVFNTKIDGNEVVRESQPPILSHRVNSSTRNKNSTDLSLTQKFRTLPEFMSLETDIPIIPESELPELIEELDFNPADGKGHGERKDG